jgi:tetratricopeptide (TPR) repeat protein
VFVGGFTLEAAERVCASGELETAAIVDALTALVDESLVHQREGADGELRFDLLETIREYGLFRLIERRELDEVRARHTAYFVTLAEAAEPELVRSEQAASVKRLDEEAANTRAALAWSLDSADLESGLRIAGALFRVWSIRGQLKEARRWLEQALRVAAEVSPAVRAKALFAAGYCALGQGDFAESTERFEQSLEAFRALDDGSGEAACLAQLGWLHTARGDLARGVALSEESLDRARALGEERTASVALTNLGDVAFTRREYDRAAALYEEGLALRRTLGDTRIVADSLLKLGRALALRGDVERAAASLEEGLATARELGDGWTTSVALASLAFSSLLRDDGAGAEPPLAEALVWARKRGDKRLAAECLTGLASVSALRGEYGRAATLWGAADAVRAATGSPASPVEETLLERHVAGVRAAIGEDALADGWRLGRELAFDEAVAEAQGVRSP